MLERFLLALDRYPRICQAVLVAALALSVVYLPKLKIDDSPERWLPASTQAAWKVLDEHFGFGDSIAVGVEFNRPVRDTDLVPLRRLRKKLAASEAIQQVYDASLLAEEIEDVPLTELIDPANSDRFGLYEAALWNRPRPGQSGRTLLTVCELVYPSERAELDRARRQVLDHLHRVLNEERKQADFADAKFHVAGAILIMDELEQRARSAAFTFLPLSICVGLVSLLIGFRSGRALLLATFGGAMALVMVLGLISWSETGVGVLSTAAPPLISIIAIATTIHFAAFAANHGYAAVHTNQRRNLVSWVAVPCFGAAATTAIGFLMLSFNELRPVRDLGYQLFAGALLAFVSVFILSQVMPIRRAYAGKLLRPSDFVWWADVVDTHHKTLASTTIAVMFAFTLMAIPWSPTSPIGLKVDVDPFSFFGPEMFLSRARDHLSDEGFGLYQLDIVLVPHDKGRKPTTTQPADEIYLENQRVAEELSDKLAARSDLGVVRVISTYELRDRQNKFYEDLQKLQQEEGLLAAAKRVLQLAKTTGHLKKFQETFENWNRDRKDEGAIRLTFLVNDTKNGGFAPLVKLAEESLPERFNCYIAGTVASVVYLADGLISGLASGLASAALVMGVVCTVLFRSLRLAMIAFAPNAFPIVIVYGTMGLTGVPLSSGTAMVATVALGIALNDTVHFVLHYRKLTREAGHSQQSALRETFEHIGRPVLLTTVVHVAGFLILMATDFLPLFHFGLLASVAMLAALVGDAVLLPSLLRVFDKAPGARSEPAAT